MLERWRDSGLSVARFCREQGVSPASFYNWRRKEPEARTFVEIAVEDGRVAREVATDASVVLSVTTAAGDRIEVRDRDVAIAVAKALVRPETRP